ncbi:MAG: TetR/AcrR family transcriptional regulator [Clostridia bacterium]|nr:TetR/AcrR family transcriptional regulator [Clostridia bacterium]
MCAKRGDTMPEAKDSLIKDEMTQAIIDAVEEIAMAGGAATLTVTQILRKLDISNRVFYNRFPNIETVLDIVYRNTIVKIRSALESPIRIEDDFFEYVKDVVSRSLLVSYEVKMKFNQYIFEEDSLGELNRDWWTDQIKKLIVYAKEHKLIKDVDEDTLAYSIWCFCRGYNADAVARGLPQEKAVDDFKYSFSFLLEGLKI